MKNELRYFGMKAPRGSYWFNFDPATFLECGVVGTFGGWQEGDSSGRMLVDGKVAAFDADGEVVILDPQDVRHPISELSEISWDKFREFLECGQQYE